MSLEIRMMNSSSRFHNYRANSKSIDFREKSINSNV